MRVFGSTPMTPMRGQALHVGCDSSDQAPAETGTKSAPRARDGPQILHADRPLPGDDVGSRTGARRSSRRSAPRRPRPCCVCLVEELPFSVLGSTGRRRLSTLIRGVVTGITIVAGQRHCAADPDQRVVAGRRAAPPGRASAPASPSCCRRRDALNQKMGWNLRLSRTRLPGAPRERRLAQRALDHDVVNAGIGTRSR